MAPFHDSALRGPPLLECRHRRIVLHRPVLQAQLQQELVRLADGWAGADAKNLHDLVAVEVGPDGVQFLLLLELSDALLQAVVRTGERGGLALVPRGAVGAGQLVEAVEQRARVPYVAADRRVRPLPVPYPWNRRCNSTSRETSFTRSLEYLRAVMRFLVILAPTTS